MWIYRLFDLFVHRRSTWVPGIENLSVGVVVAAERVAVLASYFWIFDPCPSLCHHRVIVMPDATCHSFEKCNWTTWSRVPVVLLHSCAQRSDVAGRVRCLLSLESGFLDPRWWYQA